MIYCQIKDNVVTARALFDAAMPDDWPDKASWVFNEEAQIGWSYANGTFTAPPPPPPTVVLDTAPEAETKRGK